MIATAAAARGRGSAGGRGGCPSGCPSVAAVEKGFRPVRRACTARCERTARQRRRRRRQRRRRRPPMRREDATLDDARRAAAATRPKLAAAQVEQLRSRGYGGPNTVAAVAAAATAAYAPVLVASAALAVVGVRGKKDRHRAGQLRRGVKYVVRRGATLALQQQVRRLPPRVRRQL